MYVPVLADGRRKLERIRLSFLEVGVALAGHKTALLLISE